MEFWPSSLAIREFKNISISKFADTFTRTVSAFASNEIPVTPRSPESLPDRLYSYWQRPGHRLKFGLLAVNPGLLEHPLADVCCCKCGGILFGLTHVALDLSALEETGGIQAVLSTLMVQTLTGWFLRV